MRSIISGIIALWVSVVPVCQAVPSWLDTNDVFFSFQGAMGGGDIDRVVPAEHAILGGLQPGRDWFAWIEVAGPDIVLSSWGGYLSPPIDTFINRIDLNENWQSVGPFNLTLEGEVQPDGGIYICISQNGNEDCIFGGPGTGQSNQYTFNLALEPLCSPFPGGGSTGGCFPGPGPFPGVPEPATLALLSFGLAGLGFSRRKKNP